MDLYAAKLAMGMIAVHEGCRSKLYFDTVGVPTIGFGRNLATNGLRPEEILGMFMNDVNETVNKIEAHTSMAFYNKLSVDRKAVVVDMVFNLGLPGFLRFRNLIKALDEGDWASAGKHMMQSKWATQVGQRALDLAAIMKTGIVPSHLRLSDEAVEKMAAKGTK